MAEAIPTSNKPEAKAEKAEKAEKVEKKDILEDAAFQAKVKETIVAVKGLVDDTEAAMVKTEETKLSSLWKVGGQMNKLLDQLGSRERKVIVERFHKEIGMDISFFYKAMTAVQLFTKEQFEALKKNRITMRVLNALIAIKDEKLRAKAMEQAINSGLDEDGIRSLKGKKGARREAYAKKRKEADKKKPPMRVFQQTLDRVLMVEEAIGSSQDAIPRLAECKTEDERMEAIKVLIELRKKLPDIVNELNALLKFTANFSKPGAK